MSRIITDFDNEDLQTSDVTVAEEVGGEEEDAPEGDTPPQSSEDDLAALLDAAEAEQTTTAETETPAPPDFNAPEMADLKAMFEEKMGISLEEAYKRYTETVQTAEQAAEAAAQATVKRIQSEWGVNDAEFNRRAALVTEYAQKLSPELQAKFDSVEGVQEIWRRIEGKSKPATTAKSRASGGVSPRTTEAKPTFKRSELQEMQIKQPKKYTQMQSTIAKAYQEGRVLDD